MATAPLPPSRPDADVFEAKYPLLRRKLLFYFGRRHCPYEELTDETLFRVAVKVAGGQIANLDAYAYGVARNVYADWRERQDSEPHVPAPVRAAPSARAVCLERCLRVLPAERREMIEAYFMDDDPEEVAASMGIGVGALRSRVSRLKRKLACCVATCSKTGEVRLDTD